MTLIHASAPAAPPSASSPIRRSSSAPTATCTARRSAAAARRTYRYYFRVRRQGGSDTFEVIGFLDPATAGNLPIPSLLASDGFIYGTAGSATGDQGRVFRFDPLGSGPPGNQLQLGAAYIFPAIGRPRPAVTAGACGRRSPLRPDGRRRRERPRLRLPAHAGDRRVGAPRRGTGHRDNHPAGNSSLVAAADGRLYGVSQTSTGDPGSSAWTRRPARSRRRWCGPTRTRRWSGSPGSATRCPASATRSRSSTSTASSRRRPR